MKARRNSWLTSGRTIAHLEEALKIQNVRTVGIDANAEVGAPYPHDGGLGLDDKIRFGGLEDLADRHLGQALEELDHGIALILGGVEHVGFDAHPALGGNRQGGIINKGDLGFGHGLGPEYIARLHPIIHLNRDGRELPASQDVDPTFHLGQASHRVRLGAGKRPQTGMPGSRVPSKRMHTFSSIGLLW